MQFIHNLNVAPMEWLNYHHLLYFWTIAREGSVSAAARVLNLSQPALSTQIHQLEASLGEKLFERSGRGLQLTASGRMAFRYADEIFTLGREFQNELKGRPTGRPLRLAVGISDALPKRMVHQLLRPALELPEKTRLSCREGSPEQLLPDLLAHDLDLLLSDAPLPARGRRLYNHLLGECTMAWFATEALLRQFPDPFPRCLDGAPVLLPAEGTLLRQALEQWFRQEDLHPVLAGEFDDSALLKAFGAEGEGFFAAPGILGADLEHSLGVRTVGITEIRSRIYAISPERRVMHPAVLAIQLRARRELFGSEPMPPA
jgi:LysR family transcriptional activator of nhaA